MVGFSLVTAKISVGIKLPELVVYIGQAIAVGGILIRDDLPIIRELFPVAILVKVVLLNPPAPPLR